MPQTKQKNKIKDKTLAFFLDRGTLVHINGVPAYLENETLVRTHRDNIPLMFDDDEAKETPMDAANEYFLSLLSAF